MSDAHLPSGTNEPIVLSLMTDQLLSAVLPEGNLRAILATTSQLSQQAREVHEVAPAASELFARALTSGLLLASLQKEDTRVNLQLTCDGPVRGYLVDASSAGTVRGYLSQPSANTLGAPGAFRWRPLLGNQGHLSVLRDRGVGEHYRSSIELHAYEPAGDLQRFFAISEQLPTEVWLDAVPEKDEPLGLVAGLLLQPLPDGDPDVYQRWTERLRGPEGFLHTLASEPRTTAELLVRLFPDTEVRLLSTKELSWKCGCSRDRVLDAVRVMGRAELEDVLRTDKRVEATCHFCNTRYVVEELELQALMNA